MDGKDTPGVARWGRDSTCHSSKGERVDSETLSNISSSLVSQANVEKYIWNWKKYTIGLPAGYIKIMATKKIVVFNDQIWNRD